MDTSKPQKFTSPIIAEAQSFTDFIGQPRHSTLIKQSGDTSHRFLRSKDFIPLDTGYTCE
ncbi:hypothetical protein GCM10007938_13080 [Vibrio zhanjiangensis]|uniref:Uncharacterized protein n=1 Tax=Vibrio zhanjiangensis TaxID=1046128 RepID=A0ABQ6EWH7_9VIBR|nr:hypothetical protein GCM10007938_13080 [Vibrio zhanjiangensis]